jgi:hypothetical protein
VVSVLTTLVLLCPAAWATRSRSAPSYADAPRLGDCVTGRV